MNHFLHSQLPSTKGIVVRVTPYIGLAYWDGADDGSYDTPTGSYNLAGGGYPNLYSGRNEYGNYITANPIVLNIWGASPQSEEIGIIWGGHCPVFTAWNYTFNPYTIYFDVMNNSVIQPAAVLGSVAVPATPATFQEAILLNDYGKVVYFKVEFGSSATPNIYTDTFYVLALEVEDVQTPDWDNTFLTDTPFGGDLYYSTTGSQELVVDRNSVTIQGFSILEENLDISLLDPDDEPVKITTWYDGLGIGNFVWLWIN